MSVHPGARTTAILQAAESLRVISLSTLFTFPNCRRSKTPLRRTSIPSCRRVDATAAAKQSSKLAEVKMPTQILNCTYASQDGSTGVIKDNFGQECKLTVKCSQFSRTARLISSTRTAFERCVRREFESRA